MTTTAGCPIIATFDASGFPPNKLVFYSLDYNGLVDINLGCGCPTLNGTGDYLTTLPVQLADGSPFLLAAGQSVTISVTVNSYPDPSITATGSYTLTLPS